MLDALAATNLRVRISEAQLRDMYLGQGLTIEKIAAAVGLAPTTVRRRMTDLGLAPRRRGPVAGHPRRRSSPDQCSCQWTPEVAYVVGLIATDGCLSRRQGLVTLTSKDMDLLETAARCLGVKYRITLSTNPRPCGRLQWRDTSFHRWLLDIGLTPAKSLTLGPLAVPDEYFADFLRGCIDGDGSIVTYVDRYNAFKSPTYVYTRLYVSIVSASPRFLGWLKATVLRLVGVSGRLTVKRIEGCNDLWCLKYAKRESLALLRRMYYSPEVPSLRRKREIAAPFLVQRERPPRRGPGRPMVV